MELFLFCGDHFIALLLLLKRTLCYCFRSESSTFCYVSPRSVINVCCLFVIIIICNLVNDCLMRFCLQSDLNVD